MKLPPVQPRSRRAHEAAHWARAAGYFNEYNLAIFRAFFERGEDIGKKDVLVRLASDLGLDGQALGVALEQGEFEVARVYAERAISIRESAGSSATVLADTRFLLARALWNDHAQRSRAHALARQARDGYIEDEEGHDEGLGKIELWLAEHPAP